MPFDTILRDFYAKLHPIRWPGALSLSLALTLSTLSLSARADVIGVGDIVPLTLNDDGTGAEMGPLIIGDTGVGGLFMDIAPPLSGPLQALSSDTGVIGNGENSIGAAVFDDFGVRWEIDTSLTVGNDGQGFLDVFESALIQVGGAIPSTGTTIIGDGATGQGIVRLDGIASRLTTGPLTVGDEGVGTLEAANGASFVSTDSIIGNLDGSIGTVSLTGLGSRWTVGDSGTAATLTIGNGTAATDAYGVLNINTDALVQTTGIVTVNETGTINLGGGILRDVGGSVLSNGGLIRGDGAIDAAMTIVDTGQLRNAAATANLREQIVVTGTVDVDGDSDFLYDSNVDGLIESLGGEMEFHDTVTNEGVIVGRDAILRFRGSEVSGTSDLDNNGLVVLGGNSTVYGTVTGTGMIDMLNDSLITIVGDVVFSEPLFLVAAISSGPSAISTSSNSGLSFSVGDNPASLTILGDLSLASDSVLELDYSSDGSSQAGDSFQVLSAQTITGTFANEFAVADGRFWDVDVVGDEVMVTATNLTVGTADFNADGRVDGLDLLTWQIGYPSQYDMDDLARWEAAYGESPGGAPVATVAAVPEPSTLLLALSTLGLCTRRRERG